MAKVEKTMGLKGGHVWEQDFDCLIPAHSRLGPSVGGERGISPHIRN